MTIPCVYCLRNNQLREEQILMRGENLYVCAPRGQLIEGYLAIAPYHCIGSFSRAPESHLDELARMSAVVTSFYERVYGAHQATFYEQGRAGRGALLDKAAGFPLHAHLCCLPQPVDLHSALAREFEPKSLQGPRDLPAVVGNEPYAYIDLLDRRIVYLARSEEQRVELESKRLKHTIAELIGLPERADWRDYPGDHELEQLIECWRNAWPR